MQPDNYSIGNDISEAKSCADFLKIAATNRRRMNHGLHKGNRQQAQFQS